jgi:hypothetical protein
MNKFKTSNYGTGHNNLNKGGSKAIMYSSGTSIAAKKYLSVIKK